nr:endonuclease/exonuclease/phosphatase family protein [Vibrio vulnificus]
MKAIKTSIAVLVGAALLSGCNDDTEYVNVQPKEVKIATYNLSFDRATFETLVDEMQIEPTQQAALVTSYLDGSIAAEDKTTAEKVIQIR